VQSKSDPAKARLDQQLRAKVEAGSTESVPVMVATSGDVAPVKALLDGDSAASKGASRSSSGASASSSCRSSPA
jgi:hypothetical protein